MIGMNGDGWTSNGGLMEGFKIYTSWIILNKKYEPFLQVFVILFQSSMSSKK
jgi:hypothetical protein